MVELGVVADVVDGVIDLAGGVGGWVVVGGEGDAVVVTVGVAVGAGVLVPAQSILTRVSRSCR